MVVIFLCAAADFLGVLLTIPHDGLDAITTISIAATALLFLCACGLLFYRLRWGYVLGLAAGLIGLLWLVRIELSLYDSSWITLNFAHHDREFAKFAALRILGVGWTVAAIACSSLRLLPGKFSLWPGFAGSFLVLAGWFLHSAEPYRVPVFADGPTLEFRILHVQKHGLRMHESTVLVERNSRVGTWRTKRRLFQYQFENSIGQGVLPPSMREHARAFAHSAELLKLRTPPAKRLKSWNAEGWYIVLKDSQLFAFSSEYQTAPPREAIDLFQEIESLPRDKEIVRTVQDVCLGFCYGPAAALGFQYPNEACFALTGEATYCH